MTDVTRSATQMVKMFEEDPTLMARLKSDSDLLPLLQETANKAEQQTLPWNNDRLLYRIAVIVLGALALIAAVGSLGLTAIDRTTPDVLIALGSAAVGALVGLFAPSPTAR